jgi:formylglycine-generating enzyme required for sulfatase activity
MVVIPAGTFRMGDIQGVAWDSEKTVHQVSVARFAMGKYEVTFAEYDQFAEATGRSKPNDEGWGRGHRPVINVSLEDATAYLDWLTAETGKRYRLPTEAEWEYAARAGTETKYWWGNEIGTNLANCRSSGSEWSHKQTAPVGSFEANPFGIYDTVGNVWEWCPDSSDDNSQEAPTEGRLWNNLDSDPTLFCGGSFVSAPSGCRAAIRDWVSSVGRYWFGGFRGCVDL